MDDGNAEDGLPYLNPTDQDILITLVEAGGHSPEGIGDRTGRNKKNVGKRLARLREESLVSRQGHGSYVITQRGRESLHEYIEDVLMLELQREGLIDVRENLTERGREWLNRLKTLA